MTELSTRIMTGALLVAVLAAALFVLPSICYFALLMVIWGIALLELFALTQLSLLMSLLCLAIFVMMTFIIFLVPDFILLQGLLLMIMAQYLFKKGCDPALLESQGFMITLCYGLCLTIAIIAMWQIFAINPWAAAGLFGITAGSDVAAYFSGRVYGKRKLCEMLSPGKTVEGAVGALVTVSILTLLVVIKWQLPLMGTLLLALCTSVFSIMGDLLESWLKRLAGVKDSGNLLPGHGGMLDRIDAIILAAPVYFLLY